MMEDIPILDFALKSSNPQKFDEDLGTAAKEWGVLHTKDCEELTDIN